jgi:ParB family chromosome partitioning protein
MFTSSQFRVFLSALVNLDPYDFVEDVAAFYVGGDENNQQTPDEVLSSTVTGLPDEKLTEFALRLVLTGHTDIPRDNDCDFLSLAESAFVPPQPEKPKATKPKPTVIKAVKASPKKARVPKKKIAA